MSFTQDLSEHALESSVETVVRKSLREEKLRLLQSMSRHVPYMFGAEHVIEAGKKILEHAAEHGTLPVSYQVHMAAAFVSHTPPMFTGFALTCVAWALETFFEREMDIFFECAHGPFLRAAHAARRKALPAVYVAAQNLKPRLAMSLVTNGAMMAAVTVLCAQNHLPMRGDVPAVPPRVVRMSAGRRVREDGCYAIQNYQPPDLAA